MASTFLSTVSGWISSRPGFSSAFPGGLHYDAAPADPGVVYPYVVFAQTDSDPTFVAGRRSWSEFVSITFKIQAAGDQDIDDLAMTLESILFSPRGEGQEEIAFSRGRCIGRRGGVKSLGLARAMGVGGVDVFQATIDSTWFVARDY